MDEKKGFDTNTVLAFVIGALAGALIGIILAPVKSGINMRNSIDIAIGAKNGCNNNEPSMGKQSW